MPNSVLGGARPRRATVLMLAALVAVPAAATRPSAAEAVGTGAPSQGVVLPQDPAEADLGRAVGSLDALVKTQRIEADVAAKSVAGARARLEAADTAVAEAEHRLDALVATAGVAAPGFLGAASTERPRSGDPLGPPRPQPAPAGQPALPLPLNVDAALVERFDEARDRLVVATRRRRGPGQGAGAPRGGRTRRGRRRRRAQGGVPRGRPAAAGGGAGRGCRFRRPRAPGGDEGAARRGHRHHRGSRAGRRRPQGE